MMQKNSIDLTEIFPSGFDPQKYANQFNDIDPISAFLDVLIECGMEVSNLDSSGEIARVPMAGDKKGNKNGAYAFYYSSDFSNAWYGDWKEQNWRNWCSLNKNDMSTDEICLLDQRLKEQKENIDAKHKAEQDIAAKEVNELINNLPITATHPYLEKKQVKPYGVYTEGDNLVIPARNIDGEITTVQRIFPNGDKRFYPGGKKKGSFHLMGNEFTEPTYIVEGYATGATIHELTDKTVVVAFDAGNLKPVIDSIQNIKPPPKTIICADNDKTTKGNPGLTKAKEAAKNYFQVSVVCPELNGSGTDFNDLFIEQGAAEVLKQLNIQHQETLIKYSNTTVYQDPVPLEYVVDDYLVAGTTSMLFGAPGVAKSFLAQDMGMCVATGVNWHGREVHKGSVFYVCGEGHQDLPNRIHAWKTHHNFKKEDKFPFFHSEHEINMREPQFVVELIKILKKESEQYKFRLIIVDTLSTNFGGGDENSGDMAEFISAMNGLARDTGAHVMIIHHTGKDKSKGARGHSSAHGDVYTYMPMDKTDGLTRLTMEKQKGGPDMKPLGFKMDLINLGQVIDSRGRTRNVTSLVLKLELDANKSAEAAAQIMDNWDKGMGARGKTQKITLNVIKKLEKQLDEDNPYISQNEFYDELKKAGVSTQKTTHYRDVAVKKGWLTKASNNSFYPFK